MSYTRISDALRTNRLDDNHIDNNRTNLKNSSVHSRLAFSIPNLQIAPFFILAFLYQLLPSRADSVYARDPSTDINYLIDYSSANFPHLQSALIEYCKAILYDTPQTIYHGIDSPHCVSQTNSETPGISLSVAIGRNISENFESCLNQMMKSLCDEYYHLSLPKEFLIGLAAVAGILFIGCFVTAIFSQCKKESSVAQDPYVIHSTNSLYTDDYHLTHHHHHGSDPDVSVVWGSSSPHTPDNPLPDHHDHTHHHHHGSDPDVSVVWGSSFHDHHSTYDSGVSLSSHSSSMWNDTSNNSSSQDTNTYDTVSVGWSHDPS